MEQQLRDPVAQQDEETKEKALQVVTMPTNSAGALLEAKESPPQTASRSPSEPFWRKIVGQPRAQLPLFHRFRNGDVEETMWGPSAVQLIRWAVILILGALFILKGGSVPNVMEALKWLFSLR